MININNIQRVKRVLKGQSGISIPISLGNQLDFSNLIQSQKNALNSISPMSINVKSFNQSPVKSLGKVSNTFGLVGRGSDMARGVLFNNAHVNDSALTSGINSTTDAISSSLMGFSPIGTIAGGAMKLGSFMGDALSSMGIGTDQMTKADQILDSSLLKITPFGLVNAIGAKRTQDFAANEEAIEQVGGSYGGTVSDINDAVSKAGKKYGLFSNKKRKQANKEIDAAREKQNVMTDIANEASDRRDIAVNMSDINHLNYSFNLNGGYDQRYIRAARMGDKLNRIKKLKFHKTGSVIQQSINVNTKRIEDSSVAWSPVITKVVEEFESGGELKWTPIITLQEGGKTEKVDGITGAAPKITFQSWYNTVPKDRLSNNYDLKKAFEVLPFEELEAWRKSSDEDLRIGKNHLRSIYQLPNGDYEFLKLGNEQSNPEVHFETDTYHSGENGLKDSHDLVFEKDRYFYRKKPKQFKSGGKQESVDAPEIEETNQKNVIPEGALHAHKHHMDNADNLTKKGIPVVDNDGEQQAEIEKNEIIFTLEVTKKLEELYSKYTDQEYSQKEKDEVAIEAGKLLVKEILFNTDDRTSLIDTLKQGGKINEPE